MRLISWNVQWCRGMDGRVDPKRIAAEARRLADPDVICLQELARNFPDMEGSAGEDDLLFAESFEPRYPIELTKAGQYFGKPFFTGSPGPRSSMRRPSSRSPYSYGGMEYRVECPYCGKTFKRSKWGDTKLNEHKDQYGNRCYGRVGHMVY